jgi:16S rRNA processing protein RimM
MTQLVVIGRVLGSHGLHGWVRILPLTDDPARFRKLESVTLVSKIGKEEIFNVLEAGVGPDVVRLRLEGVEDRDAADALRGRIIKGPRRTEPLPADTYYTCDLVGLRVETDAGEYLGDLEEVVETGSNDVYVVRQPETRCDWMVPALKTAILSIDIERRLMVVRKDWVT